MKAFPKILGAVGVVTLVAIPAIASGADTGPSGEPAQVAAAQQWTTNSDVPASAGDRDRTAPLAASLNDELDEGRGRSVSLTATRQVGVIPTRRGELCFSATDGETNVFSVCGALFAESGVGVSYNRGPGTPTSVTGVVAKDVTTVMVHTTDGRVETAEIVQGVIWWSGSESTTVDKLVVTRAGKTIVQDAQFVND